MASLEINSCFAIAFFIIQPQFAVAGNIQLDRYAWLGDSPPQMLLTTLTRPDPDDIEAAHGAAGERFVALLRDSAEGWTKKPREEPTRVLGLVRLAPDCEHSGSGGHAVVLVSDCGTLTHHFRDDAEDFGERCLG